MYELHWVSTDESLAAYDDLNKEIQADATVSVRVIVVAARRKANPLIPGRRRLPEAPE